MPVKNIFSFRVITDLTLENETGSPTSKPLECQVTLDVSPNLNLAVYIGEDGITEEGLKPATITLLGGLACLIAMGDEKGYWSKEDHFDYIIKYLREMVDKAHELGSGTMTNDKFINPLIKFN